MPVFIGCLLPVTIGIYTDFKTNKLYDAITIPILLSGLVYASSNGALKESLVGAAALFLVYFALAWFIGGVGGGDIKLAAGIGAWFGLSGGIYVIIIASFLAIVGGIVKLAFMGRAKQKLKYWLNGIWLYLLYKKMTIKPPQLPQEGEEMPAEIIPFGMYMGVAVWVWFLYTCQPWLLI